MANKAYREGQKVVLLECQDKCSDGHCLVSWGKVCLPEKHGGTGVLDLKTQNTALLLVWILENASFHRLTLGKNHTLLLWYWPVLKGRRTFILHERPQFIAANAQASIEASNTGPLWKWNANGMFSVSSAYSFLIHPGVRSSIITWEPQIPEIINLFFWLLCHNKLLTQQNLRKRGWPHYTHCILCREETLETASHLSIHCPDDPRFRNLENLSRCISFLVIL